MNWCECLYVGEKAKRHRDEIMDKLREGKLQPEVYLILPPGNPKNVLDIIPSAIWQLLPEKEQENVVGGIAVTYWEAMAVARQIVDDLYRETGGFCLSDMIKNFNTGKQSSWKIRKIPSGAVKVEF